MYREASTVEMKVFRGRPQIFRSLGPRNLSRRVERRIGGVIKADSEGRMSRLVVWGLEVVLLSLIAVAMGRAFSTSIGSVE